MYTIAQYMLSALHGLFYLILTEILWGQAIATGKKKNQRSRDLNLDLPLRIS